jgi:ATP-dependent protease HslVU (ClpYQ) peptidase subunit
LRRLTTIACNREELYGDLQFTNGTYKFKGNSKVYKIKAHPKLYEHDFIVGFAGVSNDCLSVRNFFENPDTSKPRVRELYGLVLTATGEIYRFDNDCTKWHEVRDPFCAIGSGRDFAMGAMAMGASPKEAVKIAMTKDIYSGMGVKGFRI